MDTTSRKRWLIGAAIAALVGGGSAGAQRVSEAEIRLRDALHKEQVEGNLAAAIAAYEQIASDHQTPRPVAAQALLNLGRCQERLDSREARRVYERLVQLFADQPPATEARARLAALRVPAAGTGAGITSSKLASAAVLYSRNASADGRQVVAATVEGFGVVDLMTGGLKNLPFDPARQRGQQWTVISPDARRVASPGRVNGVSDFRVMNVDGSGIRVLKFPAGYSAFSPSDWSRDGRTIVGMMFRPQPTPSSRRPLPSITAVDVATGTYRPLDDALDGLEAPGAFLTTSRLSPDGTFVAFVVRRPTAGDPLPAAEAAGDIYTMRVDGRDRQRLSLGEQQVELVGWLPDGRGIAFVSEQNGVRTMFAIPVQGGAASGAIVTVFRGVGRIEPLGFTASGALTYAVDGRVMKSYIADLTTTPPSRAPINPSDREWDMHPSWSPDGRSLAFVVTPAFAPADAEVRLLIRNMATQTDRVLLRWKGSSGRGGSWTADGTGFVLSRRIGPPTFGLGGFQIDRVDVASGDVQTLLPAQEAPSQFPRLAPDGRYLYFVAGGTRLIRMDLLSNQPTELASIADWYDLSRDGAHVAYIQPESSSPVLKVQPAHGGQARVVMRFPPENQINSLAFDAKARWLYFAKVTGGESATSTASSEIHRVAVDSQSGTAETVGVRVVMSFPDISMHPDAGRLAFQDNQWSVDFWQMNGLVDAFRAATRRAPASAR